jgi:fucose permease
MVNMMSYSFMVLFLPMNFPCVYVLETYGLRWGVLLGIVSTAVGLWMRCLIN